RSGAPPPPRRAPRAQPGLPDAGGPVHVVAHLHQRLDDLLYLLFRRRRLHHDHHGILNLLFHRHPGRAPAPVRPPPRSPSVSPLPSPSAPSRSPWDPQSPFPSPPGPGSGSGPSAASRSRRRDSSMTRSNNRFTAMGSKGA